MSTSVTRLPVGAKLARMGADRRVSVGLAATSAIAIVALVVLTGLDGPQALAFLAQAVLVVSFIALAVVDLRLATAIALVELVAGGSSGQWTTLPGAIHGRIFLDMVVAARAFVSLVTSRSGSWRGAFGAYGLHALALAIVIPGTWMLLGLLNGNAIHDIISDGNAQVFFSFALAFIALVRMGHGPWLRRWLLVACAINAVIYGAIALYSMLGFITMEPDLRIILWDRLGMGNSIGFMPNGAYRLYLANGLYLQIGVAAVTWELLQNRRNPALWSLLVVLGFALIASYTRGFWVGAAIAFAVVLVIGSASWRAPAAVAGGTLLIAATVTAGGLMLGFSLPDYLADRTTSIVSATTPPDTTGQPPATPAPGAATAPPDASPADISGEVSNGIRIEQARILAGHIAERPVFGWGFGSIASDYQYGTIPSYELAYLDLLFKTGLVGLCVWLSWSIRVLVDLTRARVGRLQLPDAMPARAVAVPIAVMLSVLVTGATNPYMLASYGMLPLIWPIAWLERRSSSRRHEHDAIAARVPTDGA